MTFITKKALPRRTFLKGLQATLALPLLDAMIPAATAWAQTPARPVRRLGFVYIPMGCDHGRWTPTGQGALGELPPILAPLEGVKEQLTVVTNLRLEQSYPGTHDTANAGFLSAAFAKHTESSDYYLGTTVDQVAAKQLGRDTQLPSLELAMDLNPGAGVCNNGYACVYQNCLSWSSPTTPLPAEAHPRIVFERLFGEGGPASARRAALRSRGSLLDSFNGEIARLKQRVGPADRARVDQYLDSIRQVERQIERAEAGAKENTTPDLDRPVGVPAAFADHAKLMFDLQVLAFQADITRVVTATIRKSSSKFPRSMRSTCRCSGIFSRNCNPLPTATALCSIIRSTCTEAGWATPVFTTMRTFQSWSRVAPRAASRVASTSGTRMARRWPISTSRCSTGRGCRWIHSSTARARSKTSSIRRPYKVDSFPRQPW